MKVTDDAGREFSVIGPGTLHIDLLDDITDTEMDVVIYQSRKSGKLKVRLAKAFNKRMKVIAEVSA